jgi:hypothetical protein
MTVSKAAHSLQRAKGALASGFATVDLHHATGHDPSSAIFTCREGPVLIFFMRYKARA